MEEEGGCDDCSVVLGNNISFFPCSWGWLPGEDRDGVALDQIPGIRIEHERFDTRLFRHVIMSKMTFDMGIAHRFRFFESHYIPCVIYFVKVPFTVAPSRPRP